MKIIVEYESLGKAMEQLGLSIDDQEHDGLSNGDLWRVSLPRSMATNLTTGTAIVAKDMNDTSTNILILRLFDTER